MNSTSEAASIQAALNAMNRIRAFDFRGTRMIVPDESNRSTKDIDCLVFRGRSALAVEHSRLERHHGQAKYVKKSQAIVDRVNQTVESQLRQDRWYTVILPAELVIDGTKKTLRPLEEFLVQSLQQHGDVIPVEAWLTLDYRGFSVSFYCGLTSGLTFGRLYRSLGGVPGTPAEVAGPLLRRLLAKKVGKLSWYQLFGCTTLLVIEDVGGSTGWISGYRDFGPVLLTRTWLLVKFIVVVVSNVDIPVIAKVWKRGLIWYRQVPMDLRFDVKDLKHTEVPKVERQVAESISSKVRSLVRHRAKTSGTHFDRQMGGNLQGSCKASRKIR